MCFPGPGEFAQGEITWDIKVAAGSFIAHKPNRCAGSVLSPGRLAVTTTFRGAGEELCKGFHPLK